MAAKSRRAMIILTERKTSTDGPGAEREYFVRNGIPVSRIRKAMPVTTTNWAAKERDAAGGYGQITLTQLALGSPEEYLWVTETIDKIAALINEESQTVITGAPCRTTRHPGESSRPTEICLLPYGHLPPHQFEEIE